MAKSKSSAVKATWFKDAVTKDKEGTHFAVPSALMQEAFKAAVGLDRLFIDVTPVALNLYLGFKELVTKTATLSRLQYFAAFHPVAKDGYPAIPTAWGAPNSPERKAVNSNKVYNKLAHLAFKIGKIEAGDAPKRDPKVAKDAAKAKLKEFGNGCKRFKFSAPAVKWLVQSVLGFVTKDGKNLTKKGKGYLEIAGLVVSEDE